MMLDDFFVRYSLPQLASCFFSSGRVLLLVPRPWRLMLLLIFAIWMWLLPRLPCQSAVQHPSQFLKCVCVFLWHKQIDPREHKSWKAVLYIN